MVLNILAFIGGLALLLWSADRLISAAVGIADLLRIPSFLIGLTVVAFGTSAPEIMAAISASRHGFGAMAVGNAIGSNLANICLVLGCAALWRPLPAQSGVLKRELPLLIVVMVLVALCLIDAHIGRIDAVLWLCALCIVIAWLSTRSTPAVNPSAPPRQRANKRQLVLLCLMLAISLGLLIASSEAMVWGLGNIARKLGISELIIGLTVVAVGTSLPELATALASVWRGSVALAWGNVLGSNIFNLLAVLAVPGLIQPLFISSEVLSRDYAAMAIATALFAVFLLGSTVWRNYWRGPAGGQLGRFAGVSLLAFYLGYYGLLFYSFD